MDKKTGFWQTISDLFVHKDIKLARNQFDNAMKNFSENPNEALKFFNEAISLDPSNREYYTRRGYLNFYRIKNFKDAYSDFLNAIKYDKSSYSEHLYEHIGLIEYSNDNFDQAISFFTKAMKAYAADKDDCRCWRGMSYIRKGKTIRGVLDLAKSAQNKHSFALKLLKEIKFEKLPAIPMDNWVADLLGNPDWDEVAEEDN